MSDEETRTPHHPQYYYFIPYPTFFLFIIKPPSGVYTFKVVLTSYRRVFSRYCGLVRRPKFEPAASRTINNSNILFPRNSLILITLAIFFNRRNSVPRITDSFSIFAILSQIRSSHLLTPCFAMITFNVLIYSSSFAFEAIVFVQYEYASPPTSSSLVWTP